MVDFVIRRAMPSDAASACDVVRRSINLLCLADHHSDERTISRWLANKTEANFNTWIKSEQHVALVAEKAGQLVGFALLRRTGILALLYVAPESRYEGISKALLWNLERQSFELGVTEISIESSLTALRFYRDCGYISTGAPVQGFGVTYRYPMSKRIAL
jgi:GNAT superfamily N-acetyltransferase